MGSTSYVYENNTRVFAGVFPNFAAGDRFKIIVTGDAVTYEHNGSVFSISTNKPTFPLVVNARFYHEGAKISDVKLQTV
jgi:hypothetical protein